MEEIKMKVTVEVTAKDNGTFLFDILAPELLNDEMIRSILAGGLALSIRAEKTPKEQAKVLRDVIEYLESEFIDPDSFSDAQNLRN